MDPQALLDELRQPLSLSKFLNLEQLSQEQERQRQLAATTIETLTNMISEMKEQEKRLDKSISGLQKIILAMIDVVPDGWITTHVKPEGIGGILRGLRPHAQGQDIDALVALLTTEPATKDG